MTEPSVQWHISFRGGPLDGVLLPVNEDRDVSLDDPAVVHDLVVTVIETSDTPFSGVDAYRWSGSTVTASPGYQVIVMVIPDEAESGRVGPGASCSARLL